MSIHSMQGNGHTGSQHSGAYPSVFMKEYTNKLNILCITLDFHIFLPP